MKFKLFLCMALAFAGCKSGSDVEGESSSLSTVTIGKFNQASDAKAWATMQIAITDAATGVSSLKKTASLADFGSGANALNVKLKYGSYRFLLEYFDASKTLLYRSCLDQDKQDPIVAINDPKVSLKVNICAEAAAGNPGESAGSIGEADVIIQPVLKGQPSSITGPVTGNFLSVDAAKSLRCLALKGAKFGDAAAKVSYLCAVNLDSKAIPAAGFYLKGNIKVAALGRSVRLTMSGFGLKDATGRLSGKTWSARDGAPLTVNETVPVELGKDACLAGKALAPQIGNVTIFTDAGGGLAISDFASVGFTQVSCK